MTPSLIAVSGSLKGKQFSLTGNEVSLGREPMNSICLNDLSISRRHCLIKRTFSAQNQKATNTTQSTPTTETTDQFTIIDLDSFNGTFVNGIPVKEHVLEHGDQVALGDVFFLFLLHEAETEALTTVMDESDLIMRSTVRLQQDNAFYLRPEKISAELPASARIARDLNTLLKIGTSINSIRNVSELIRRLLELIVDTISADRAAIVLVDNEHEGFISISGWTQITGFDQSVTISRTITNQVVKEAVALLSNDIVEDQQISTAPSLMTSRVCSLLCVPLIVFKKVIGVIYLDTSNADARFDEEHLQLLTAIAGISAVAIENARSIETLHDENQRLQSEIRLNHKMIGESARMRDVYSRLARIAAVESTVLIRGESGTGKELAAHAIHLNSPRAAKPFVAINCATLSETLLESELFGHEKGAFTGAIVQKLGKLEIVDGGTLLLDEIGELTPAIQAKLLRVLQERQFERVGGTRAIKIDVRIIAATNRDLEAAVAAGQFRADLYYRINVVGVTMPALRERREDVALLATYFTGIFSNKCKRRVKGISPEARKLLQDYDWPGNVRQLENAIERAVVLGATDVITPEDLPENIIENAVASAKPDQYYEAVNEAKKQILVRTLKQTGGNYSEAAKLLGIHPNNLHRLVRTLGLRSKIEPS